MYTGKSIEGPNYMVDDIGEVVCRTTDLIMPLVDPKETDCLIAGDGFVIQNDNWQSWHARRPFSDVIETGGMFVASSSEINPPVKPENFRAMVEAVGQIRNVRFTPQT